MSTIRLFEPDDARAVADLFQRTFRKSVRSPPPALVAYIRWLYADMPGNEPDIRSLVHTDDTGALTGFVGVIPLRFRFGARVLRAALCGTLMVRDARADPLAGARLMKAFMAGPQDISLSESANTISATMWSRLRGVMLPDYSFDWIKLFQPAAAAVDLVGRRIPALRMLSPLAQGADLVLGAITGSSAQADREEAAAQTRAARVTDITAQDFIALIEPLTHHYPIRPQWADGQLEAMLADAANKPERGAMIFARVEARTGVTIGALAFSLRKGRLSHILQVLARPGQEGPVLDALIATATARGAAGLRGRTQPALMEAMFTRHGYFLPVAATVVHARDPELVQMCRNGGILFNGLAGENWSRLIGGSFH